VCEASKIKQRAQFISIGQECQHRDGKCHGSSLNSKCHLEVSMEGKLKILMLEKTLDHKNPEISSTSTWVFMEI
jgi:hypothetical protein